jgi:hypothetical protein
MFRKNYSYGKLGNKGSPSNSNKIFGGIKNVGIEFAQHAVNHISPQVEKKVINYLEKK